MSETAVAVNLPSSPCSISQILEVRALVVHGLEGLDEISLSGPSRVSELGEGRVGSYTLSPEEVGFHRCRLEDLHGGSPEECAAALRSVLNGEKGPKRDIVLLNGGAALILQEFAQELAIGLANKDRWYGREGSPAHDEQIVPLMVENDGEFSARSGCVFDFFREQNNAALDQDLSEHGLADELEVHLLERGRLLQLARDLPEEAAQVLIEFVK